MPRNDSQPRDRNVAHLWADKRVMRLLRKQLGLDDIAYKNYRAVYLALCEIDSDFCEDKKENANARLHSLTKTCAAYAGLSENLVIFYMRQLRKIGLIDYGQEHSDDGRFSSSFLHLWMFEGGHQYERPAPRPTVAARTIKNPCTVKPVYGFSSPLENNTIINNSIKKSIEYSDSEKPAVAAQRKTTIRQSAKTRALSRRKQPNPAINQIVEYFKTRCQAILNINPDVESKDYALVKKKLSSKSESELRQIIDECLTAEKLQWQREHPTLSVFLSVNTINQIKVNKSTYAKSDSFYTPGGGIKGEPGKYAHLNTKIGRETTP